MYEQSDGLTTIFAPTSICPGTITFTPVFKIAGLNDEATVWPFITASASIISSIQLSGIITETGSSINIYNEEPVSVIMPESCIEEIIEADAVIKGQTVSSSFKPAILKNGVKVMVPGHIEVGTKIVVRPSDCSYIEKAKI